MFSIQKTQKRVRNRIIITASFLKTNEAVSLLKQPQNYKKSFINWFDPLFFGQF